MRSHARSRCCPPASAAGAPGGKPIRAAAQNAWYLLGRAVVAAEERGLSNHVPLHGLQELFARCRSPADPASCRAHRTRTRSDGMAPDRRQDRSTTPRIPVPPRKEAGTVRIVPSGRSPGPSPSGSPFAVPGMLNADQCSVSAVPLAVEFSTSWKMTGIRTAVPPAPADGVGAGHPVELERRRLVVASAPPSNASGSLLRRATPSSSPRAGAPDPTRAAACGRRRLREHNGGDQDDGACANGPK